MKHIVSFETAKALEAAGYPQPELATGQVWHYRDDYTFVVGRSRTDASEFVFICLQNTIWEYPSEVSGSLFYAPSATEITHAVSMTENSSELYCSYFKDNQCWQATDGFQTLSEFHENPAEAAAELWLKINAK